MTPAYSAWSSASVSNSYTSSFSSANIKVYGGTFAEIKKAYSGFPDDATGHTVVAAQYIGDFQYYNGSTYVYKSGCQMASVDVYIATDRANTKTYKHEAGHSLGWFGHSSNSADIMYSITSSVTGLTTRDTQQLVQVY